MLKSFYLIISLVNCATSATTLRRLQQNVSILEEKSIDNSDETYLTQEDFEMANENILDGDENGTFQTEMQTSSMFEGDISGVEPRTIDQIIKAANNYIKLLKGDNIDNHIINDRRQDATNLWYRLWPDAIVPYSIENMFTSHHRAIIASAIQQFHKLTCIRFVPRTTETDYVLIKSTYQGCNSALGRIGGQQNCVHEGVAVHELMHAIGFFHEQNRNDRDHYVTIQWENIIDGLEGIFQKRNWDEIRYLGPYDYESIMHYTPNAFTKNGMETIKPLSDIKTGDKSKFSAYDIYKINRLYNCSSDLIERSTVSPVQVDSTKCVDKADYCQYWKDNGHCGGGKYKDYMQEMCAKKCGFCTNVRIYPRCMDTELKRTCKAWYQRGYCHQELPYTLGRLEMIVEKVVTFVHDFGFQYFRVNK